MRDASTPGRSVVADRPAKVCPGNEGHPCGKEIPAIRTWCEECSAERLKLKVKGRNSRYYQANAEPLKEKSRARYRLNRERDDCKIAIKVAAWIKREMDRERDIRFGFDRPPTPPHPKAYLRTRQPRRDRVLARAQDLVNQELRHARERLDKAGRPLKHLPYRPPRLQDISPQPEPAETTVTGGRYKTRIHNKPRRKKRGRPRLTVAEQLERIERREKRAVSLVVRVYHEKMAHDEAWYAVNTKSKASPETATREARREIAWLLKRHPLVWEDHLYFSGLYDFDEVCRNIKDLLSANRCRKGEPTDLPDWPARIKGLKLLLSYLGLATPRGFRSGPYAVGGELEHEPLVGNDAPPGDEDAAADVLRRRKAEAILFRNQFEGRPLADCWLEINRRSKANRNTAKKEAAKLIAWYRERYSSSLAERLIANGLDVTTVLTTLKEMKEATLVCDGTLSDYPDWRVRDKALGIQMLLHGCYPPPGRSVPRRTLGIPGAGSWLYGENPVATEYLPDDQAPPPRSNSLRTSLAGIYWRHYHDGMPLADCWCALYPSDAGKYSEESSARIAAGQLAFFQKRFPMPLATMLEVYDLGLANLLECLQEQKAATYPLKVQTKWWKEEDGSPRKEITYIQQPDNRAFASAIGKQMILLGLGWGAAASRDGRTTARSQASRGRGRRRTRRRSRAASRSHGSSTRPRSVRKSGSASGTSTRRPRSGSTLVPTARHG